MKNEKKLSLLLLLQTAFTKDITCFSTIWYRLHLSLYFRPGIWACNHLKMTCYMLTDQEPIALVLTQMRVAWVWMPVRWKWMQRALDQPALSDELGMRMHCYFKQVIVIMIWSKSSIHERLGLKEQRWAEDLQSVNKYVRKSLFKCLKTKFLKERLEGTYIIPPLQSRISLNDSSILEGFPYK